MSGSWKISPEQRQDMCRLYVDEKLSTIQVAERFDISAAHVAKILKADGVQMRPKRRLPKYDPDAIKVCETCGGTFGRGRRADGKLEIPARLAARRYCSRECKNAAIGDANHRHKDALPWTVGSPGRESAPPRRRTP